MSPVGGPSPCVGVAPINPCRLNQAVPTCVMCDQFQGWRGWPATAGLTLRLKEFARSADASAAAHAAACSPGPAVRARRARPRFARHRAGPRRGANRAICAAQLLSRPNGRAAFATLPNSAINDAQCSQHVLTEST